MNAAALISSPFVPTPFIPTPEADLLLACARLHMGADQAERVRRLAAHGVDWSSVYQLAERHGVLPLLARHLPRQILPRQGLPQLPAWLLPRLQTDYATLAQHNLLRARALVALAHHLAAHAIPAIFYKGALTASTLYGDLALRPFGDVDVLVHPHDLWRARDAILALGYSTDFRPDDQKRALHEHNECSLREPHSRLVVDLHWRVSPATFVPLIHESDLWARAVPTPLLRGASVTTLHPQDQLLVMAVHAAKSCWEYLKWIGDFAAWLHVYTDWDWATTLHAATRLGCRRILLTSFALTHHLLDTPLPPALRAAIEDDPQVTVLAQCVAAYLWQTPSPFNSVLQRYLITLRLHPPLLEQRRHRLHYLRQRFRDFVSPNDRDRAAWPLPPAFNFLYWGIRPWRLWKTYVVGRKEKRIKGKE